MSKDSNKFDKNYSENQDKFSKTGIADTDSIKDTENSLMLNKKGQHSMSSKKNTISGNGNNTSYFGSNLMRNPFEDLSSSNYE